MDLMTINISEIPASGMMIDRQIPASWLNDFLPESRKPGITSIGQLIGNAMIVGDNILVSAELSFASGFECSRCSEDGREQTRVKMDMLYTPEERSRNKLSGGEESDSDAFEDLATYSTDQLDISKEIGEKLAMALNPYPLCKADCRGLCLGCGKSLNDSDCGCADESGTDESIDMNKSKLATAINAIRENSIQSGD